MHIGAAHNPFSSHHVKPGAIPWQGDLDALELRFEQLGGQAQVVGPYGSGKSTLLHHLAARTETTVVDDASLRTRANIAWLRFRHRRLLVSCHEDLGLPTLCSLESNLDMARAVVAHLLRDSPCAIADDATLTMLIGRHQGNLRLVLFDLYDRYEAWAAEPGRSDL